MACGCNANMWTTLQVLKHLTIRRPLEAVRTDFFAQVGFAEPMSASFPAPKCRSSPP